MKGELGDRIKITMAQSSFFKVGDIATIIDKCPLSKECCIAEFENGKKWHVGQYSAYEIIEAVVPKFKIGDEVEQVKEDFFPIGTNFVVRSIMKANASANRFLYFKGRSYDMGGSAEPALKLSRAAVTIPLGEAPIKFSAINPVLTYRTPAILPISKKGIRIKSEKVLIKGQRYIKILALSALTKKDLPAEYLALHYDEKVWYCPACEGLGCHLVKTILLVGGRYTEAEFSKALAYLERCGENLTQINKMLKKKALETKEVWSGRQEITV